MRHECKYNISIRNSFSLLRQQKKCACHFLNPTAHSILIAFENLSLREEVKDKDKLHTAVFIIRESTSCCCHCHPSREWLLLNNRVWDTSKLDLLLMLTWYCNLWQWRFVWSCWQLMSLVLTGLTYDWYYDVELTKVSILLQRCFHRFESRSIIYTK